MNIQDVICSAGKTGFYFDDQRAIKAGALHDGFHYQGAPMTEGFTAVRQAGESLSIQLLLDDGQVALGDCAAVQYSGAGGRDPLFLAESFIPVIQEELLPRLRGMSLDRFKPIAEEIEAIRVGGKPLHTALRYGVSQALLDAVAKRHKRMICEQVVHEYGGAVQTEAIPIFTQSGDLRYDNADKMIIKEAGVLPHALINNVEEKLGHDGEKLQEYVAWLSKRIQKIRSDASYQPILHIDVYGTIGQCFGAEAIEKMGAYLASLAELAKPFQLRIEGPMDADDRGRQIESMAALTRYLDERGIPVQLVADEWCNTLEDIKAFADAKAGHMIQVKTPDLGGVQNTVEAVQYCKAQGILAYQGGTCNETDRSSQVCVHLAMATGPEQILAKPGMGVDEGYMIVYNEMQRILAMRAHRQA